MFSVMERNRAADDDVIQKLSHREQILRRPDTVIGSVDSTEQEWFVLDDNKEQMQKKKLHFSGGLLQIFEEILTNAADNRMRDPLGTKCANITVERNPTGSSEIQISVHNDGNVLPIRKHTSCGVYIPELAFGSLLTSENYDDGKRRTSAGRNGYGSKVANIFSKLFEIEIVGKREGKGEEGYVVYKQRWRNNMSVCEPPVITTTKAARTKQRLGTTVRFVPDLSRFGEGVWTDAVESVMRRRVWDFAATTGLRTTFNGCRVPVKNFREYVRLYRNPSLEKGPVFVFDKCPLWEICLLPSRNGFQHVSFVNNLFTPRGGTHVRAAMAPIEKFVCQQLRKRRNGASAKAITGKLVREHCMLFVNCFVNNPSFDTQTKTCLTLDPSKFGSTFQVEDQHTSSFHKLVQTSGVIPLMETVLAERTEKRFSKLDGSKKTKLHGVPKLEDANWAGSKKSQDCTLILTEGDSAKALAVAGLSVLGRNAFGVFPLKGKIINASKKKSQVYENTEVQHIMKILGLKTGKTYTSVEELRYGHVMIMADQDCDGSHIKGLLLHLFQTMWPSLLQVQGFMQQFITPIIRVTFLDSSSGLKKQPRDFFSLKAFHLWESGLESLVGPRAKYRVKYYKGLGTSTSQDARKYFSNLETHRIVFSSPKQEDVLRLHMAFGSDSSARKKWIQSTMAQEGGEQRIAGGEHDTAQANETNEITNTMSFKKFVDNELVEFAISSVSRAVPSMWDGLKPSQRKVLHTLLSLPDQERKVSQLMGIVSDKTHYHHGEASLGQTIVRMAQVFCGKNTINFLRPSGQFGTRMCGGSDSADPRYIFTQLDPIVRSLFRQEDDILLENVVEDGYTAECKHFLPVIPMVLVNGAQGIAMGHRCMVPPHCPRSVISAVRKMLAGEDCPRLEVFYRGFKGNVEVKPSAAKDVASDKIIVYGSLRFSKEESSGTHRRTTVLIEELPVGIWTEDYVQYLEKLLQKGSISNFQQFHTEHSVHFRVHTTNDMSLMSMEEILDFFRLKKEFHPSLVMFDSKGKLCTYRSIQDICKEFFNARLKTYDTRRHKLIERANAELQFKNNQIRFVKAILDNDIDLKAESFASLYATLEKKGFSDINQLLATKVLSLTSDRLKMLEKKRDFVQHETLKKLTSSTAADLWKQDLLELEKALDDWEGRWKKEMEEDSMTRKRSGALAPNKLRKKKEAVKRKMHVISQHPASSTGIMLSEKTDMGNNKRRITSSLLSSSH